VDAVAVPDAFFKIVYSARGPPSVWIFPNMAGENRTPDAYKSTLLEVEKRTGLKFRQREELPHD